MKQLSLTLMEKSEVQDAARTLSLAMLDNPLHIAVFQGNGEAQRREIETMFSGLLAGLPEIVFLAKENRTIVGVMRMKSCTGEKAVDAYKGPEDENNTAWRKFVWHSEWARQEPSFQHWHLGPIGVLPSRQGAGIGSMLMERFCREVDACGAQAYLETDLDINVRFYEKFGFKVIAETEVHGVKNRYMLRPPQA